MSDILPTMIDTENNCEQVFIPKVPSIEEIAAASKVEQLEYQMAQMPDGFFPTDHLFLPGIYIRKIFSRNTINIQSIKSSIATP